MNRVFILAALVALAGVCASATPVDLGFALTNPQASFLDEAPQDVACASNSACDAETGGIGPVSALFINLSFLCPGLTNCAGATLQIIGVGSECYAGPCSTESPADLGGVFDSNNTELASNISSNCTVGSAGVDRLTGTVAVTGLGSQPMVTNNTDLEPYSCSSQDPTSPAVVNTTIPNDFHIPTGTGITVVVPTEATYLVVGVLDSYYADDSDPSGTLGVQINEISPEPATLGLFGMGMAALLAFRRYRSR